MASIPSPNPSNSSRPSPANPQQPFLGAFSAASSAPQQRRSVMEIPAPLPRPSFIFQPNGGWSNDAEWVFDEWRAQMAQHIRAIENNPAVNYIQMSRCHLLQLACEQRDITYIVMHHRYCTWSRNKQAAYDLLRPYRSDVIDSGFAALSLPLTSNEHLPAWGLEWFLQFPAASFDAFIPSPIMATITNNIGGFLAALGGKWPKLQADILTRGFPILVRELSEILRCSSYVAQTFIFTSTRRNLGCPDGHFSALCDEVFVRDRALEWSIASNSIPRERIEPARTDVVRNYIALINQARSQASNQAPNIAPAAPPAVASLPTAAASQPIQSPVNPASQIPSRSQSAACHSPHVCGPQIATDQTTPHGPSVPPNVSPTDKVANTPAKAVDALNPHHSHNSPAMQHAPVPFSQPQTALPSAVLPGQNLAALLDPRPGRVFRRIHESEHPKGVYDLSSLRVGLHLVRQHSPHRVPNIVEPTQRHYQHVDSLIVQPTKLDVSLELTEIKFSLSEEQLQNLPILQPQTDICRFPVVRTETSKSEWTTTSTCWPEQLHMMINSKPCTLSRKQHFHLDVPVEITTHIQSGCNDLQVSLPSLSQSEGGYDYFIAVEQIITQDYATVWRSVNSNPHIAAETIRDKIKHINELPSTDEIAVLGRTANISVCDPVSSKICHTPVRGARCEHLQCFDLENWLRSRPGKPRTPMNEPCLVDCWQCPICGGDARPTQLRVCDYFIGVIRELRESGNSETRTIAVGADGEWRPVVETSGHYKREDISPVGLPRRLYQIPKGADVIEILDD
ncbi:hypothetical protein PWT90_03645 [Aphanocladium album]|nr:hypothetical protein PWT90_03645 [Aphanocladium album]